MSGKGLAIALKPLIEIRLSRHSEGNEVSFSVRLPDCNTGTQLASGYVVGANVEEALTERRIGIYRDDGDALFDGSINLRSHELGICRRHENASRLSRYSLAEGL